MSPKNTNKPVEPAPLSPEKPSAEQTVVSVRHAVPSAGSSHAPSEAKESVKPDREVIIVCGPPHSGKSVFFGGLKEHLPRRNTRLFRACPDGEGTWSQKADEEVAQDVRRKGGFTPAFMEFALNGIKNITAKRVLVDVGGIRSKENGDIFRRATHAVVLCRSDKPEEKAKWEAFAKENGLIVMASLDSALQGEESAYIDEGGTIRGQVVGLERGQMISAKALELLAERIMEETQETEDDELVTEADGKRVISFDNLADQLKVPSKGRTIKMPDKGYDLDIELPWWTGEKIREGVEHVAGLDPQAPVLLDGGHPAALYAGVTAAMPVKEIWYTDETNYTAGRGKVETLELADKPSDTLEWKVEERDDYTLVEAGWKKDVQWSMANFAERLAELKLPKVNPEKGVVISGKLAYLLFGSMARSYQSHAKWVGIFTPQQKEDARMKWPAMVVFGGDSGKKIGDYVDSPAIGHETAETTKNYHFDILDPKPENRFPVAKQHNDAILSGKSVLGIEITVPALAKRCTLGNIDPQHTENNISKAAIEVALTHPLPEGEVTMVTIRPDLDAFGAMAVLNLRAKNRKIDGPILERIQKIAASDKFDKGAWPGKQPLPTRENLWVGSTEELVAIGAMVKDETCPATKRVAAVEDWLLTGKEPAQYRAKAEKERLKLVEALERDEIEIKNIANGQIALIESTYPRLTKLGYTQAPIVIVINPEFQIEGGENHNKITLAQYAEGHVDLIAVYEELNRLDPAVSDDAKWGGSPTVGGSPQGIASQLPLETIIKVMEKHLIR